MMIGPTAGRGIRPTGWRPHGSALPSSRRPRALHRSAPGRSSRTWVSDLQTPKKCVGVAIGERGGDSAISNIRGFVGADKASRSVSAQASLTAMAVPRRRHAKFRRRTKATARPSRFTKAMNGLRAWRPPAGRSWGVSKVHVPRCATWADASRIGRVCRSPSREGTEPLAAWRRSTPEYRRAGEHLRLISHGEEHHGSRWRLPRLSVNMSCAASGERLPDRLPSRVPSRYRVERSPPTAARR
jgi:hypothetical protein